MKVLLILMSLIYVNTFAQNDTVTTDEIVEVSTEEIEAEMQVVATKAPKKISDIAADVTIIGKEDLKNTGATSIAEVLRTKGIVAMDSASSEKGAAIYIRGLDVSYTLVIVDGQRVKDGTLTLSKLKIESIERIEIVKGPSSYLWGSDAMAGVIYIQTKQGSKKDGLHGSLGTTYANNFNADPDNHLVRPHIDLSYTTNGMSFFTGGSFDWGYDWMSAYNMKNNIAVANERKDHGDYSFYGGADIDFLDIHNVKFKVSYKDSLSPFNDEIKDYNGISEYYHPEKAVYANIGYKVFPTDKLDVSLNTGITYEENNRFFSDDAGDFDKEGFIANNTELVTVYTFNDSFTMKSGYSLEYYRRSQMEEQAVDNLHYNSLNNALFLGGDYTYKGVVDIDITLGGRYQFNHRYSSLGAGLGDVTSKAEDAHSFSPEFGIVIKPHNTVAIKAHVGHSFKTPDLERSFRKDRATSSGYAIGGNPSLMHEKAWGYSSTIEYNPIPEIFLSTGIYRTDIWDLIQWQYTGENFTDTDGTVYPMKRPKNLGRAYTWGVNASIATAVKVPYVGILSGGLTVEYMVAKELRTEETGIYVDENGNNITNPLLEDRPPIVLTGSIGWAKPEWGTSILFSGYYFHSMYNYTSKDNVNHLRRTGNQTTFDLKLTQKILPNTNEKKYPLQGTIFFEMKNLLNVKFDKDFDGDTDQEERRFILGVNIDF